ncbi:uncharacterized protein LOC126630519 isoform X2 [Malus sylvestris]|nr:uncharacterized protein LOC126630519 isoform X2 [Malus sylvestris]
MGFVDGSTPCPPRFSDVIYGDSEVVSNSTTARVESDAYKIWKMHDKALMQLIFATLSPPAISCAIGSISSLDLWIRLKEQCSDKKGQNHREDNLQCVIMGCILLSHQHLMLLQNVPMLLLTLDNKSIQDYGITD